MNALEIKNLSRSFGEFQLGPINLTLPSGCILGLIGENGAGKTTTIKLILNILRKGGGSISILGRNSEENIPAIKEDVGVVMDEPGIPMSFTAEQVGKVMKNTFRNWDSEIYAGLLQKLSIPCQKPFKSLSRGMKMKLGIAIAMSHHSKLLLLDEPTGGLDPVVRDEVVEMLEDFTRDENHSILISSHIISDLEKLCDYVAFLHQGKLLLCEEKDRLLEEYGILHCSAEELSKVDPAAVKHRKESPYGVEALVWRSAVPSELPISPVGIEELFVHMIKEARTK